MQFFLIGMTVNNFKGIRRFQVEFGDTTDILGDNGTGKTTLLDAFRWLLFGKDSADNTKFEIKTLDVNNEPYHHLDHEVSARIRWQGIEHKLRRVLKEKWTTKRGARDHELTGHTQEFYWDDTPLKEGEYQAKISAIIQEDLFKLLTSPTYFNSLSWQERRAFLTSIAGEITTEDVLSTMIGGPVGPETDYAELISALKRGQSIDEFNRAITSQKKLIKDQLEQIPARIDEATRSMAGIQEADIQELSLELRNLQEQATQLDEELNDISQAELTTQKDKQAKVKEIYTMKNRLDKIEFEETQKLAGATRTRTQTIAENKSSLRNATDNRARLVTDLATEEKRLAGIQATRDGLQAKWYEINREQLEFKEGDLACPACHRPFEDDQLEEKKALLYSNFNNDKAKRLGQVTKDGLLAKEQITNLEVRIENFKTDIRAFDAAIMNTRTRLAEMERIHAEKLEVEAQDMVQAILENTEFQGLKEMIRLREEEVANPQQAVDRTVQQTNRNHIAKLIEENKKQQADQEHRARIQERITELQDQEATLAQQLANQERIEWTIDEFTRAKMDTLEARVNGRFKLVKFKMFTEQLNGGRKEDCLTLIAGVPFRDANTASKIHAGVDIINTFSDHFNIYAPIWIDNRESVIRKPETKSQLINLFASKEHKELNVHTTITKKETAESAEV